MAYKLVKARKKATEYYLKVLVNAEVEAGYLQAVADYETALAAWEMADPDSRGLPPVEPEDPRIYEEFHWGLDVPRAQIRKETKLLLDAKYGNSDEEAMAEEGENL